jgi:hypothetical protein
MLITRLITHSPNDKKNLKIRIRLPHIALNYVYMKYGQREAVLWLFRTWLVSEYASEDNSNLILEFNCTLDTRLGSLLYFVFTC